MSGKKVVSFADKKNSGYAWSPAQALRSALEEVESGEVKANKALIILLDDSVREGGERPFQYVYYQAQMSGCEIMGLCHAVQNKLSLTMMGLLK